MLVLPVTCVWDSLLIERITSPYVCVEIFSLPLTHKTSAHLKHRKLVRYIVVDASGHLHIRQTESVPDSIRRCLAATKLLQKVCRGWRGRQKARRVLEFNERQQVFRERMKSLLGAFTLIGEGTGSRSCWGFGAWLYNHVIYARYTHRTTLHCFTYRYFVPCSNGGVGPGC